MKIAELFEMAAELFHSDIQQHRDTAYLFLRDVWQVNRLWRAFHDPDNPQREVLIVARLLGVHRNTITGKLHKLGLSAEDFRQAAAVAELIERSEVLRVAQRTLVIMAEEEQRQLEQVAG